MRDWSIDYVMYVLETKDWSANELAARTGLSASTISRPIREKDYPHGLSRRTIRLIQNASQIDPSPFIPKEMAEEAAQFLGGPRPQTSADRALQNLDQPSNTSALPKLNQVQFKLEGNAAQIVALVDKNGIDKLRRQIDLIEQMMIANEA